MPIVSLTSAKKVDLLSLLSRLSAEDIGADNAGTYDDFVKNFMIFRSDFCQEYDVLGYDDFKEYVAESDIETPQFTVADVERLHQAVSLGMCVWAKCSEIKNAQNKDVKSLTSSMESVQSKLSAIQDQMVKNTRTIQKIQGRVFPARENLKDKDCAEDQGKQVPSVHSSIGTEFPNTSKTHTVTVSGEAASPKLKAGAKIDVGGASAQERHSDPVAMKSELYSDGFGSGKRQYNSAEGYMCNVKNQPTRFNLRSESNLVEPNGRWPASHFSGSSDPSQPDLAPDVSMDFRGCLSHTWQNLIRLTLLVVIGGCFMLKKGKIHIPWVRALRMIMSH